MKRSPIKKKTHRECKCGCGTVIRYTLNPYATPECRTRDGKSTQTIARSPLPKPTKKINARSKKRKIQELQYSADRIVFLSKPENRICPVTKQRATEVHHKKGRIGELLLDQRYWLGVSAEGHRQIEENPDWAKEMGYSLNRLSND